MSTNRDDLAYLNEAAADLAPTDLAMVIDLVDRLRPADHGAEEGSGEAMLAAILADPEKTAAFRTSLDEGRARVAAGEFYSEDEVFGDLLAGPAE